MSSADFYERYRAGTLADAADGPDSVQRAGPCYMAVRSGAVQHPPART